MDSNLRRYAYLKNYIKKAPRLSYLFLELTNKCNLKCSHCGSSCPENKNYSMLKAERIIPVMDEIMKKTSPSNMMFCITGGEPFLNPEWYEICEHIHQSGFLWGVTTNGTLFTPQLVEQLADAGMSTISISIDGDKASHEKLRNVDGCYQKTIDAVYLLLEAKKFKSVQITTVISTLNIDQLNSMYSQFERMGISSWKLTTIEPIGEARKNKDLFLKKEQLLYLLEFIREKRLNSRMDVTFGCNHFLTMQYDDQVRKGHFFCGAGVFIASITSEGNIKACLDIDDRKSIQGNISEDNFWDVWMHRFEIFRKDRNLKNEVLSRIKKDLNDMVKIDEELNEELKEVIQQFNTIYGPPGAFGIEPYEMGIISDDII